ncbi:hypothetical protein XELAEV_18046060mg [Xenopus laevis]|uniref:Uncharacterized protein n=1 Tax=Xenopus laevis TaxID=8355 RepID=A0A974BSJ5_XENLA|nr:hypothetical protein XELAEV_18046060mg [Xenopus laevis]
MTSHLSKFLVLFFIILAVSFECSAAPSEPMHPGDQASPEQLAKYYDDWWQYITFITRPRFGKRWEEPGVENSHSF